MQQALLDRLRVNDTEEVSVLAEQLATTPDEVTAVARSLEPQGVRVVSDPDAPGASDVLVRLERPGGPQLAAPGDDKPPA